MEIKHPGIRDINRFQYPLTLLRSIDEFVERFNYTSSSFSLASGVTSIDFELHLKKARPEILIIFLGGAKIEQDWGKEGPFFLGRSFSKSLRANCLYISDPSFAYNPKIRLGWYAGVSCCSAQQIIADLVKAVSLVTGSKKIIFFGGSGGGFACLHLSSLFQGSMALIWNPQTNIQKYGSVGSLNNPRYMVLDEYARLAFNCKPDQLHEYIITNVSECYKYDVKNMVLYLQNLTDNHVKEHLNPFLEATLNYNQNHECSKWIGDWLYLHMHDKAKGHSSPGKNMLLNFLSAVTENSETWSHDALSSVLEKALI